MRLIYFINRLRSTSLRQFNVKQMSTKQPDIKVLKFTADKENDEWLNPTTPKLYQLQHTQRLNKFNRRHDEKYYIGLIYQATERCSPNEILEIFFHDMLIRDRFMPSIKFIGILLQSLAKLGGYTDEAFKIYRKSKEIGLEPNDATFSSLFYCCFKDISKNGTLIFDKKNKSQTLLSNEEFIKMQLPAKRCFRLYSDLLKNNYHLNLVATNSLLLALGKGGMLTEAFQVIDEYLSHKSNKIDSYTLNTILRGCLNERSNGLALGLIAYKKLIMRNKIIGAICPHEFVNILQLVNFCQLGDNVSIEKLLETTRTTQIAHSNNVSIQQYLQSNNTSKEMVEQSHSLSNQDSVSYDQVISEIEKCLKLIPIDLDINHITKLMESSNLNLEHLKCIASPTNFLKPNTIVNKSQLSSTMKPSDKLVLVGGVLGFLSTVRHHRLQPNIILLTSLLHCCPFTEMLDNDGLNSREELFVSIFKKLAKHYQLEEDQAFINLCNKRIYQYQKMMIHKSKNSCNSLTGISEQSNISNCVINLEKMDPQSWSLLAKQCTDLETSKKFIELMTVQCGVVPNNYNIESAIYNSIGWASKKYLMNQFKKFNVSPSRRFIAWLEYIIDNKRKRIINGDIHQTPEQIQSFNNFQLFYAQWLSNQSVDKISSGDAQIKIKDIPDEHIPR